MRGKEQQMREKLQKRRSVVSGILDEGKHRSRLLLLIKPFQTAVLQLITPFQLLPLLMLLQVSLPTISTMTMPMHTNFLLLSGPDSLQHGLMFVARS
jgi:hypothetical protein